MKISPFRALSVLPSFVVVVALSLVSLIVNMNSI